jgi:hypothetical protein
VAVVAIRQLKRENADLRQALVAKNVLAGKQTVAIGRGQVFNLAAGDTLNIEIQAVNVVATIECLSASSIKVL